MGLRFPARRSLGIIGKNYYPGRPVAALIAKGRVSLLAADIHDLSHGCKLTI